jgi:hypothetical protein
MNQLKFQAYDEGTTTLEREVISATDARIASNSGVYLTSDAVYVSSPVVFDCVTSPDGAIKNIGITFTLTKGTQGSSRVTEYGSQTFSQRVTIRSY